MTAKKRNARESSRYKRGEVVLVWFPNSDLGGSKKRPALVVQADNLQTGLPQLVLAMITSRLSRAPHPSRYQVHLSTPEGRQSGLLVDSVVMTDNIWTVHVPFITDVVGTLPMTPIDAALRHTLGL